MPAYRLPNMAVLSTRTSRELRRVTDFIRCGFARIDNNVVAIGSSYWSTAFPEFASKGIIPRFETAVFGFRITLENFLELQACTRSFVGRHFKVPFPRRAKPSVRLRVRDTCTFFALQKSSPLIQNLLHDGIHVRILKDGEPARCSHRPIKQRPKWQADEANAMLFFRIGRSSGHQMIHEAEHVYVIPYLAIAGWVVEVRFLVRDLVEHTVY